MKCLIKCLLLLCLLLSSCHANMVIAYSSKNHKPSAVQIRDIELLKSIANKHNIDITFKATPWKRALLLLEKGMIDGVMNASYKVNRAKYALYPMKNNHLDTQKRLNNGNTYYIYKHKDSTLLWDGKKFITPDGNVGVMEKFAVIEDLKKHSNISIQEFTNNTELIRKLAHKTIVAYAGISLEVDEVLKKYPSFSKNIVRESIPIRKKEYFLIFSKKVYPSKDKEIHTIWNGLKEFHIKQRYKKSQVLK